MQSADRMLLYSLSRDNGFCYLLSTDEQGMLWNGMENGMEWKENFGTEYGRCSEWNGMEDLKNRMEDRLPY